MERNLERKFETLIQQLSTLQHPESDPLGLREQLHLTVQKLVEIVEELKSSDVALKRRVSELLFAYQTLEIGYQHYWEFFNFAPDGYLVTDTNGIIKEANQTILTLLATTQSSLIGKPITTLIPDIKQHDFGLQLNWFEGSQQFELFLHPQDSEPFYASLSISRQCNFQNETIGFLWLVRNITERKKMEEDLKKSKTQLSLILEQTPYILWTTNTNFQLTSISGAGISVQGNNPAGCAGIGVAEYFSLRNPDAFLKAHVSALEGFPQTFDFEWQGRIFQSAIEALRDSSEQITGVIGAAFDITERKNAERELKKSEKFNARLLQHSPNPIFVINPDTSIAYINPAFEKLTGFSADKTIGLKAPYPWWTQDTRRIKESFLKDLCNRKGKQEKRFRKKNGDYFWVETSTILIDDDEPKYYLQTWNDITESRRLRENMDYYIMQITRAQEEERKRIAQELHEETVQSLAALCLATEAIIQSKEQDPQSTLQDLAYLREKINGVIEEVRRFSYDLRPGVLDYLGLTAALETLTDDLSQKGISAGLKVSGKEKLLSSDMEITIFRITQEALNNITKYSLAKNVDIHLSYRNNYVKLTISDNGQGFKLPERLSELAVQGKLGLIGMEERARLHGGYFTIRSEPQKGTIINIRLPFLN
ncbi:MAG: PAS domain S-box protein [Dehalococcoidales bacterium]|nr:PAS domain S-box protein [Dehalococcoidales bacterium]